MLSGNRAAETFPYKRISPAEETGLVMELVCIPIAKSEIELMYGVSVRKWTWRANFSPKSDAKGCI